MASGVAGIMGDRFGFDFSQVRVHSDARAASAADRLGANAFTLGNDVFFAEGAYDTESPEGRHLLAHELTHVVQSDHVVGEPVRELSHGTDASEVEAGTAADLATAGLSVGSIGSAPNAAISRQGEGEGEHHHKGGLLDHLFGLNPDKSFVETGMEGLGYGPTGIWGRPKAEGEGDGTTALRALGAAATSPLALFAAIGGHGLDEINHGPSLFHGAFDW